MAQAGSSAEDTHVRGQARRRLLDPVHLVIPPSIAILLLAHHFEMTTPVPVWLLIGSLLFSHVSATGFAAAHPPGTDQARPRQFLVLAIAGGGFFLYVSGWGATLAVIFVAVSAVVIQTDGSRYGTTAIAASVGTLAIGEAAVAIDLIDSKIGQPTAHVLAVLEASFTVVVIVLLTRGQREKEALTVREREAEERFRALVQHAADAILVVGEGGVVRYASPATEDVLGRRSDMVEQIDVWVDPDHLAEVREMFAGLRAEPGSSASGEVPILRPDGTSRWVEVHITNLVHDPAVRGYVCNVRDVGERRTTHDQLVHDAHHDAMTSLPNRRLFLARLEAARLEARPDDLMAVLFVDIDHFKDINDRLGHDIGDQVLVDVASTLPGLIRAGDVAARFGGDEFTVLLEGVTDRAEVREIADRITRGLSRSWLVAGRTISLSVSVGVSTCTGDGWQPSELLRQADEAMYAAKQNGRARWEELAQQTA